MLFLGGSCLVGCGEDGDGHGDDGSGGVAGTGGLGTGGGGSGSGGDTATGGQASGTGGLEAPACPSFDSDAPTATEGVLRLLEVDIFGVGDVGVFEGHYYFYQGGQLSRVTLEGGEPELIGDVPGRPRILADRLVWNEDDPNNMDRLVLWTAPVSDPGTPTMVADDVGGLEDLLADDTHLYWEERGVGVFRVAIDGGTPELFLPDASPLGATLHDGYYYWLDFGSNQLERALLSDGVREQLTEVHFGGPMVGAGDAVYWGDTSLNTIEMWSPGAGRVRLTGEDDTASVAFADGKLYWSAGFVGGIIQRIDPTTMEVESLLCGGFRDPERLHIVDSYLVVNTSEGPLRITR